MSSLTQVQNDAGDGAEAGSKGAATLKETELVKVETAKKAAEIGGDATPIETADADVPQTPTKKKEPEEVEEAQEKMSLTA